jgi:multicomponent K+:H+ antiporter subunit D
MAFLGLSFIVCALVITGMPPLSGFVAKVLMLSTLLDGPPGADPQGAAVWAMLALLIGSGLFAMIGLSRSGVRYFWSYPEGRPPPKLRVVECLPIALILAACVAITIRAEPVMRYMDATAEALYAPSDYIASVLATRPVPSPRAAGADGW